MLCGNTFMLIADAAEEAYRHFAAAEQSTGLKQQHDVGMPLPDVASLKGEHFRRERKPEDVHDRQNLSLTKPKRPLAQRFVEKAIVAVRSSHQMGR